MATTVLRQTRVVVRGAMAARGACLVFAALAAGVAAADPAPLSERIDQLILEANAGVASAVVGDAEFLRRASLDLIGIPPSVDELRAFLADESPQKRTAAIDRLLAHPRYARHMSEVFDVMLMERRPNQHVAAAEWRQYLLSSFRENKPYNQLAKEILSADGAEPNPRAAVRFYLDRQADPHLLTRDVGRIFFGRDLQCAQCHDHPIIDDYHQADYHGLMAFFSSGAAFTAPAPDGKTYYVEKAGGDVEFESVFAKGEKHSIGAKMPGFAELDEPALYPDELYVVKPADNVRPVPKFSRRSKLAELAASGSNRFFNENIANRLWAHMMGRGLVDPVDLHHSSNPPSNPALLQLLGEEFAASNFDVKAFWRVLAMTKTYQRSIDPPGDPIALAPTAEKVASELEQRVAELATAASAADDAYEQACEQCSEIDEQAAPVETELNQATAAATEAAAKLDEAQKQLESAQAQVTAKTTVSAALSDAVAKTQEVAKALPEDQELLAAAQKFAERQQQVAAEITTLSEAAKQKAEEVKAPAEAMAAAKQSIDAVRQKLAPLAEVIQQRAHAAEAARLRWIEERAARVRHQERLETVKQLAALKPFKEQLAAAETQTEAATAALAEAQAAVASQQAAIALAEQARAEAESNRQQAGEAAAVAKAEQEPWDQLAAAIEAAMARTDDAQKLLPGDPALVEASTRLAAKRDEIAAASEAPRAAHVAASAAAQAAQDRLAQTVAQKQAAETELVQRQQAVAAADQAATAARAERDRCTLALNEAVDELSAAWVESFAMLPLKPLTPEQLGWSIFHVTGVYDRRVAAEREEMDKATPLSEADKADPAKIAARELELQQRVYDKLQGEVAEFVAMYAPAAGQPQSDFFATANQALFVANGGKITDWAAPAAGNVTERAIQQPDPTAAAEELYLSVLSRRPSDEEIADVAQFLSERPEEKAARVQQLVWSLLTSVEFRFNH